MENDKEHVKKILLLLFKRSGDLFLLANIVQQLQNLNQNQNKYKDIHIDLLIYDEFLSAASIIPHIHKIHFLERKTIISLKENPLFNWAWGLNNFLENLQECLDTSWDEVYNFSYGVVETYISNALQTKKISGPILLENGKIAFSNKNCCYFNENKSNLVQSSVHLLDFYKSEISHFYPAALHKSISNSMEKFTGLVSQENELECSLYFKNLRRKLHLNDIPVYIIGIQLSASNLEKQIDINIMQELLYFILEDKRLFPLLILAPSATDHQLANELNKVFNNKLISIDCDFKALSSVITRIDFLLTPDTAIKHLANWVHCKQLEIHKNADFVQLHGSKCVNDLILYPKNSTDSLCAKDLYKILLYGLKLIQQTSFKINENWVLLENVGNNPFIFYWPIQNSFGVQETLQQYIEKLFYYQFNFGKINKAPYTPYLQQLDKTAFFLFLQNEKKELISIVNNLLELLKEIRKFKLNKSMDPSLFLQNLQKLLDPSVKGANLCVNIPLSILQYNMEGLPAQVFPYQIDKLENVLFDFKNNLNIFTHILELMSLVHLQEGIKLNAKI